eukprot:s1168_g16.t1
MVFPLVQDAIKDSPPGIDFNIIFNMCGTAAVQDDRALDEEVEHRLGVQELLQFASSLNLQALAERPDLLAYFHMRCGICKHFSVTARVSCNISKLFIKTVFFNMKHCLRTCSNIGIPILLDWELITEDDTTPAFVTFDSVQRRSRAPFQLHVICSSLRVNLETLTEIQLADILLAGRASDPRLGPSMCIKSVRWALKQFGIQCFKISLGPLISSFNKDHMISDRREALPYSLITVVQWERRMLQSSATQKEVLGVGSFLLMLWSGMRFADLQRTRLSSLAYDLKSLRGLSFRTKTCKSGCPFGVLCRGFLSSGSFTWVHRFLQALDAVYAPFGLTPHDVDFVIPSLDDLTTEVCPSPMTYAEALYYCRHFLALPWRKQPVDTAISAQHYTVHGLKSTLLSFANQLQLAPEQRRLQGKHKDPLQSTRLYSRDDVSGALQLQEAIVAAVQRGWRPHTPLGRGGQIPLPEQSFTLEKFKKDDLQAQRSSKQPKLEGLALHSLLLDEPPALEVSNSGMGLNAIRTLIAVAMCRGAHLANLKQYSHKFTHYLTQKVDTETGLRTANVTEAQAADRQIWATMA